MCMCVYVSREGCVYVSMWMDVPACIQMYVVCVCMDVPMCTWRNALCVFVCV